MPARKVARKKVESLTPKAVCTYVSQFLTLKRETDQLAKRRDEIRDRLKALLETEGYTDDKGSLYVDLEKAVEGPDGKLYGVLKNERRVSQVLNEEKATAMVQEKGLGDRCIVLVPTLDEEEVLKAHYEGLISQEEVDSIFETRETYAFRCLEG